MIFEGEEFLEFATKSIRNQVDHISVTYQSISYFGNPSGPELENTIRQLQASGLVDEAIYFEPDLSLPPKDNEARLRNLGLDASKRAGCTHHISADVDELYLPDQLDYAKNVMEDGGYDFSLAPYVVYYKEPTFLVHPNQDLYVSFIHPVDNHYNRWLNYPEFTKIEITRRLVNNRTYKVFTCDELTIHHMSYVRRDIRKKFANSDNGRFYKINKFVADFEKHNVGDRVCLLPDFINRKTVLVDNIFGITLGDTYANK
jgi:hypothetical protein